jgi:hypothetical protein
MKTKVAKRDVHHLKMSLRMSIGTPNHKKNIFHFYILNNIFTLLVQIYIVAIIPSVILEVLVCCLKLSSTCKQKNYASNFGVPNVLLYRLVYYLTCMVD